jgi:sec-independent protein translocase protein TatB
MLPGVDFTEMLLVAVIAVVVFGPRDLPLMMRKVGRFTGKMRAMAFEFKQGFEELGRQAELEELRKEVADLKKHTGLEDLREEFEADKRALEADVRSAMSDLPEPKISPPEAESKPETESESASEGGEPPALPRARSNFPKPHRRSSAAATSAAAAPAPAAYAGLSPEHPGYDIGDDVSLAGEGPEQSPSTSTPPEGEAEGDAHVVPDDEVRPTHPAAKVAGNKQGTPA